MHLQWFASLILIINSIIPAFPELLSSRPVMRTRALRYLEPPPDDKRFLQGIQKIVREHQHNPETLRENLQKYLQKFKATPLSKKSDMENNNENEPKQSDTKINNVEHQPQQSGTDNFKPPSLPLETWQWMCSFPGCVVPSMDAPYSKQ